MTVERLAVIGTGLIGTSVGLAARRAGVGSVAGHDTDQAALAASVERGAVDVAACTVADAVAAAELVVVATPVSTVTGLAEVVLDARPSGCVVTDVGSTKGRICTALAARGAFVGGHPLSGSEESGPDHASAELFDGARWFLTPVAGTDPVAVEHVSGFVASLGAVPVEIDPESHDRLVALVSHLPHALANLLVAQAGAARLADLDPLEVAGASFRDLTRIAGANPSVWADIFLDNAESLAAELAAYRGRIEELEQALRAEDGDALRRSIEEAAGHRRRLLDG